MKELNLIVVIIALAIAIPIAILWGEVFPDITVLNFISLTSFSIGVALVAWQVFGTPHK